MKERLSRRDFLKAAGLVASSLVVAACRSEEDSTIEPSYTILQPTPTVPTSTETSPTEILPTATLTPEQRFKIGPFDFAAQIPFSLAAGPDLRKLLGHSFDLNVEYTADLPLAVLPPEYEIDYKPYIEAATNRPDGNPVLVYVTNQKNHLVISDHSLRYFNPTLGSLARELVGWAYKNPEKVDELYALKPTFEMNGITVDAEIANLFFISENFWMGNEEQSPRWEYQGGLEFIDTEILGIPDTIRADTSPNFMYITVVSCLGKEPGVDYKEIKGEPGVPEITKGEAFRLNTSNRTVVTFKIPVLNK